MPVSLQHRSKKSPVFSPGLLILLTAAFIAIVDNRRLWSGISERMDIFSVKGAGYVFTMFVLITALTSFLVLLLGQRKLLKPLLILMLVVSSVVAYFNQVLGVIIDVDMVRNIIETMRDSNTQEANELLSASLLMHVLLTGIVPSILIALIRVKQDSLVMDVVKRFGYLAGIGCFLGIMVFANFKNLVYFSRENEDLKVYVNPLFPIDSVKKYVSRQNENRSETFVALGQDARQKKSGSGKIVGIMVVGETARADHFSLNGYQRNTNPLLAQQNIVNFKDATACGTSTAYSVPCMFSFLDRVDYSPEKARGQSNVLDVLTTAGVKVVWLDNNSSCKGVCARIESENLRRNPDSESVYYSDGEYYDEILLQNLSHLIDNAPSDVLIVLHTLGSHGPAYYRRFPAEFAKFKPYCVRKSPQECGGQEITNAYDNTILYTDYILTKTIELLRKRNEDTFMMYASDHGESLGENGIYLHGLPWILAPEAQTHIPMLAWFSDSYISHHHRQGTVEQGLLKPNLSHDNISATLLGLYSVKTEVYRANLDIFDTKSQSLISAISPPQPTSARSE